MKKIFKSSGIEVRPAIWRPDKAGFFCASCGFRMAAWHHCLRCGQPLYYHPWEAEEYKEVFKNVEEEIEAVDARGPYTNPLTGEAETTLAEKRAQILKGINVEEIEIQ